MKYIVRLKTEQHELFGDGYIEHITDDWGFVTIVHDKGLTVIPSTDIVYILISSELELPEDK